MDGDYCWADGKSVSTYDRSQNYIYDGLMVKMILRMDGESLLVMFMKIENYVREDDNNCFCPARSWQSARMPESLATER